MQLRNPDIATIFVSELTSNKMLSLQDTSISSLTGFLGQADPDEGSVCTGSCSSSDQPKRWERNRRPSDIRPGLPLRQASTPGLDVDEFIESNSNLLSLGDSLTSFNSTIESDCEVDCHVQRVTRTLSCDSLPQIPKRQASGRKLVVSPMPNTERRARRSARAGSKRLGPPSIPRRQASGNTERGIQKSPSSPALPIRYLSFRSCAGSAA